MGVSRWIVTTVRRLRRTETGQSLVEFAIVLPVLLGLVVGIFEFGRAWNVFQVLTNAAREGARLSVVRTTGSEGEVENAIHDYLNRAGLDPSLTTIAIDNFGGGTGQPVSVRLEYPYEFQFLGPIVGFLGDGSGSLPGSVTLSTTAVMRSE